MPATPASGIMAIRPVSWSAPSGVIVPAICWWANAGIAALYMSPAFARNLFVMAVAAAGANIEPMLMAI